MSTDRQLAGVGYGLLAYGMWGFFPLFFHHLAHVAPMDVLSNRAAWAFVFVGALLTEVAAAYPVPLGRSIRRTCPHCGGTLASNNQQLRLARSRDRRANRCRELSIVQGRRS